MTALERPNMRKTIAAFTAPERAFDRYLRSRNEDVNAL